MMNKINLLRSVLKPSLWVVVFLLVSWSSFAEVNKIRVTWNSDPSTSLVLIWNQISGSNPYVLFDNVDHGSDEHSYAYRYDNVVTKEAKGMNNAYAKLKDLQPGTTYYFMIGDSEGCTKRYFATTISDAPNTRLSIIAGGDSRNLREARLNANKLVAKLHADVVLFSGDMTGGNTGPEWERWLDDWQSTISDNGRITPIVVARGNHEFDNKTLYDLFATASQEMYYALNFGGGLLRVYTLNSMVAPGGNQAAWLQQDLQNNADKTWKMAMYHYPIRPHTAKKPERNDQYEAWAELFHDYQIQLAIECDAHLVKTTWPIRPSTEPGSQEGFIRDDVTGTVFAGEGGWGAPLRPANDEKNWTRNSGSFNQFKWIFVDQNGIELRTVKVDNADQVETVTAETRFSPPTGLIIWNPSNGPVVEIRRDRSFLPPTPNDDMLAVKDGTASMEVLDFGAKRINNTIVIEWKVINEPCQLQYEVMRSINGGTFEVIGIMDARCNGGGNYKLEDIKAIEGGVTERTRVNYKLVRLTDGNREIMAGKQEQSDNLDGLPKLMPDANSQVTLKYNLSTQGMVTIHLFDQENYETMRLGVGEKPPGTYLEHVKLASIPSGKYLLSVKSKNKTIIRYQVLIRP